MTQMSKWTTTLSFYKQNFALTFHENSVSSKPNISGIPRKTILVNCLLSDLFVFKRKITQGRKTKRKKYFIENFRQTSKYCLLKTNRRQMSTDWEKNRKLVHKLNTQGTNHTTPTGSYSKYQTRETGTYRKTTSQKYVRNCSGLWENPVHSWAL